MRKLEAIFCCLCVAIALGNVVNAKHDVNGSNETLRIDLSREVTLYVANDAASLTLKMSLLNGDELARQSNGRLKFKNGILQRLGMAMMMAPLLMQLMWLPGTIASLKMSFLRSILVGKLALAVMLYNTLKSSQKTEVVLIHKPEYHEHYYHSYHQPEDDDEGWFGR
ncbi:unnamed protein product [Xylocopa violacea]|uniref:Uncharacterized protein n=1 Tax=Xylocopa violacea TaxID=135666 RepID=A0ABP1NK19_XYLVO